MPRVAAKVNNTTSAAHPPPGDLPRNDQTAEPAGKRGESIGDISSGTFAISAVRFPVRKKVAGWRDKAFPHGCLKRCLLRRPPGRDAAHWGWAKSGIGQNQAKTTAALAIARSLRRNHR